ncbi:ABC transporter ATP-binding protein [Anaerosinus massiliensis]|uniref:ABC transporter ATP-binding protein n=1 Tax=Massilibacillus massiliensis TaxID=1806837 RepID=UPI000A69429C|nr:ABC transporter ATP-binding protein [Massilibacillus massiliensis]
MIETAIEFKSVVKKFNNAGYNAVDHVSLSIQEGEFVTILGSSGCGKTTLLKMINRLYEPNEGEIQLYGEDVATVNVIDLRRHIGYVIQQVGLFPHMTIAENIATVPKLLKWDKEKIENRVRELLSLVELKPDIFMQRYPVQLSGGQQQRVGLARAMAADPKIMLLDEPFGAVDAITRINLQNELLRIHEKLHNTFVLVTHDIHEAFALGDRTVIMHEGKIRQIDTPENIKRDPADDFVSSLIDSSKRR